MSNPIEYTKQVHAGNPAVMALMAEVERGQARRSSDSPAAYTCRLAERIGNRYSLAPQQVTPPMLRTLARTWHPRGRDLSKALRRDADRLERALARREGRDDG